MKFRITLLIVAAVAVSLIILRLFLPTIILNYANKTLNKIPEYEASIGGIDVSLWRGAYVIRDLQIYKRGGQKKFPFLKAPIIDLAIEWPALIQGKVVGKIKVIKPTMNFIQSAEKNKAQLTANSGFEEQGKKLFPLQINRLVIQDGTITFRELETEQETDLHLTAVHAELTGITNVESASRPLPVHLKVNAVVFDTGKLALDGSAQILRDPVSFDINAKVESVDLTKLNPYVRHHAGFDFKSGTFALYSSVQANHGELKGYVKPLFDHIVILSLKDASNPLELVWEAVAATVVEIFTNHSRDRLATVIPLSGRIDDPKTNLWATLFNIVRNAFVQAFTPGLEKSPPT